MAEFSQLMAQMIAEARPKQAGGQTLPHVFGGGGGMGTQGKSTASEVSVKVDLDPWMRLFGHRSDTEMKGLYDDYYKQKAMNPDSWTQVKDSLFMQKALKGLYQRGHPVKVDKDGFFDLPEVSQEERVAIFKPTKEHLWSGAFGEKARGQTIEAEKETTPPSAIDITSGLRGGPEARELYLSGQERIAKAQQPWTKERALVELGPQAFSDYVENTKKIEEVTNPLEREMRKAQIKASEDQSNLFQEQLRTHPESARQSTRLASAEADFKLAQKKKLEQEYRESEASSIGHLTPEERTGIIESNKAYDGAVRAVEQKYAQAYNLIGGKGNAKTEFERLMTIGGLTEKHLASTDPIINPPGTSAKNRKGYPISSANLQYFTQQTTEYIANVVGPMEEIKGLVFKGPSPQRQEAEQRMIQLMDRVVQLHSQYWSTPTSKAVALIYSDALDAFKEGKREEALMILGLRKPKGK